MKRLFTLIVLLGMLGLFAGCGNSDSSSGGGGGSTPTNSAAVTNATK